MNKILRIVPLVFTAVVLAVLFVGWRLRNDELITPGSGVGFVCGILGTVMMFILLFYPFRKRVKGTEFIGSVKGWFRVHMILGILGPVLILFHSNFHFGSLNSNVALISMMFVSGSGIFGRYIYNKIHYGLYGERANLQDLKQKLSEQKEQVQGQLEDTTSFKKKLSVFAEQILIPPSDILESIGRLFTVRFRGLKLIFEANLLRRDALLRQKAVRLVRQIVLVSEFNFFERLFSLWHILHLPLVFILGFAIIVHILAVNHY